jgi:hypothetical protein
MGTLTFMKKKGAAAAPEEASAKPAQAPATNPTGFNFFKRGSAAKQAMEAADAKAEMAKAEAGKLWRYWMAPDEDRTITFLDGVLDEDGMLDLPMFEEHELKIAGEREHFVCVNEQEICPICEKGDSRPVLVGVLTVLDHKPHKIKTGPNAGKTIQHTRKLFVAKRQTIKKLSKKAQKYGGLVGCTFEVSRTGDKEPSVGSDFEFVEQLAPAALAAKYGLKLEDVQPADYDHEITYRTAADLVALGVGKAASGPGYEKGAGVDTKSLAQEL